MIFWFWCPLSPISGIIWNSDLEVALICLDTLKHLSCALNLHMCLCIWSFEIIKKINILLYMNPCMQLNIFYNIIYFERKKNALTHIHVDSLSFLAYYFYIWSCFLKLFGPGGMTMDLVNLFCGIRGSSMLHVKLTTRASFCSCT